MSAKIYRCRDGSYGASCDGVMATGHYIRRNAAGLFTVHSIHDMDEDVVIAKDATREEAEKAIAEDWRTAD